MHADPRALFISRQSTVHKEQQRKKPIWEILGERIDQLDAAAAALAKWSVKKMLHLVKEGILHPIRTLALAGALIETSIFGGVVVGGGAYTAGQIHNKISQVRLDERLIAEIRREKGEIRKSSYRKLPLEARVDLVQMMLGKSREWSVEFVKGIQYASERLQIPPEVVAGHLAFESGKYTSGEMLDLNNLGGIRSPGGLAYYSNLTSFFTTGYVPVMSSLGMMHIGTPTELGIRAAKTGYVGPSDPNSWNGGLGYANGVSNTTRWFNELADYYVANVYTREKERPLNRYERSLKRDIARAEQPIRIRHDRDGNVVVARAYHTDIAQPVRDFAPQLRL